MNTGNHHTIEQLTKKEEQMIRNILIAAGVLAFALPTVAAANYLPLAKGDTGVYEGEVIDGNTQLANRSARITNVQGNWRHFSDFIGTGARWVWSDGTDVYILSSNGSSAQRLFNANASVGTSFSAGINSCVQGGTISQKNLSLNLAGTVLENVIRVDFNNVCGEGLMSAWFAPGVGPVKWMDAPANMSLERHYYRLAAGRMNGQTYPRQVGNIEVDIHLAGGHTLMSSQNYISELPVWIEVRNQSQSAQDLAFSSSQIMEVEVFDANGELVKRWSDSRMFSQALMNIELAAGESRWFGERLQLKNSNGEPLVLGSYEVRVTFKGHPSASAGVYSNNGYFSKTIPLHLDYTMSISPIF